MKNFWANWKTTSAAIVIVLVWGVKFAGAVDIPADVATAITVIIASIGLFFAKDADVTGVK